MEPPHSQHTITWGWQRTWAPVPLSQHLALLVPPLRTPTRRCALEYQPHIRSKARRGELELSSPVMSEGRGSSAGHGGSKQKGLPRTHAQTHAPAHPDTLPRGPAQCFDAGRHTQEEWLTPPWSRAGAPAACLEHPCHPLQDVASLLPSVTPPGGQASRAFLEG